MYVCIVILSATPGLTLAAEQASTTEAAGRETQGAGQTVGDEDNNTKHLSFLEGLHTDSDRLAALRGGTETSNDQTLRGNVGSNVATDVVSGANSISAGSFASSSGIPIVIQNSGANVLIQNATIINLQMH